jgi:hypothetical protein
MHERNRRAARPRARRIVDDSIPARLYYRECCRAVRNAISHVMESLTLRVQEFGDWRIVARWGQQLDVGVSDAQQGFGDTISYHVLTVFNNCAKHLFVPGDCRVEVVNRNCYMINLNE